MKKKIGLICLALVLALGAMGGALAYWNETLVITGTVATGELDVEFSHQKSNDDGTQADPSERGIWTFTDINDPGTWSNNAAREDYDVASTTCELLQDASGPEEGDNQTLVITISNAYPCYYGNVAFTIDNIGSIPAKIESIQLTEISKDDVPYILHVPRDLVACVDWYIDVEAPRVEDTPSDGDDFSIHLSTLAVGDVVPVTGDKAILGDISIHVEEGAEESTIYDFTILIVVTQFNAPPTPS